MLVATTPNESLTSRRRDVYVFGEITQIAFHHIFRPKFLVSTRRAGKAFRA